MSPHFLIAEDSEGGFNVCDTRDGQAIAWRSALGDAAGICSHLNACYPPGLVPPAHDSLVHEVAMERIAGEPVEPLHLVEAGELEQMIPVAIGGSCEELWRP